MNIAKPYIQRIEALLARQPRVLLGLTGAPGAGKSTLAEALSQHFASQAQIVPMDGFHLAQVELERLGRAARKGAPDTFDSDGYVALLKRLREPQHTIIYAPSFRRDLEEPIACAIPIAPETRLIITEGNYLLLEQEAWKEVATLLDEVWYVEVEPNLRLERLVARHQRFGRSLAEAQAWIASTDEPNARVIEATKSRANWIIQEAR
ncbi:nucleoside/nucleotide kinase family protein [Thiolinea disciformis]|uniref:nucleoside/nucleotide kinase family protein n=1 Tax=Thiolinea disciformis TaxID=125614 RepID=UPI0003721E95|nr:nucleoside/nucleotide kinase family protein [Thiolinea disciformis]